MKTTKKLMPEQPGTKGLVGRYGENSVRYRYDPKSDMVLKTSELVIGRPPRRAAKIRIPANKHVNVRIEYGESELGRMVKAAGGKWNRSGKVWILPYKEASTLGLTDRSDRPVRRHPLKNVYY